MRHDRWIAAHDRAIRSEKPHSRVRASLHPIAEQGRRLAARGRLMFSLGSPRRALQGSLLERLDLGPFNGLGPPDLATNVSRTCSAAEIMTTEYQRFARALGEEPRFHRKQWEYVAIVGAAERAGVLRPGSQAIGFGVGTEPIPAALAARGVRVLATDQPIESAGRWLKTSEHASSVEALRRNDLCDSRTFEELVSFAPVNMNELDLAALPSADLVWSACVIEHLGSPAAGLAFVRRTADLLRPNGVMVHTTELDLTPGPETVDYGNCAVYRLEDLEGLVRDLREAGYGVELNPYVALEHSADRFIAPPYSVGREVFHLKLALYESITTSIALIVSAPPA